VSPTGTTIHDVVRGLIFAILNAYEEHAGTCFVIDEHAFFMPPGERDYQPDVAVITDDRTIDPEGWIAGAPNIAVEVLSKTTRSRDLGLKARRYYTEGTLEYWTFDPQDEAATFRRRGPDGWLEVPPADGAYRTPLLPGFALSLPELWERVRRKLQRRH
jgi:Uma2 family endonuclease